MSQLDFLPGELLACSERFTPDITPLSAVTQLIQE